MRFHLLSDNMDTLVGMRLSGVPGEIVHGETEVINAIKTAIDNKQAGGSLQRLYI